MNTAARPKVPEPVSGIARGPESITFVWTPLAETHSRSADRRARFEATALPWLRSVHGAALHLSRQPEDARDLVQETFLRAYRTFDSFIPGTNAKAWLLKILFTVFVNRYRKARREPPVVPLEEVEARFERLLARRAPEPSRWDESQAAPAGPEVERALGGLPEPYRDVVLLVDVQELTYEEAAAALGCPVGTVRSRLFRARKLLFVALHDYARKAGFLKEPPAR
jgi:RNA polymerase sigma-70 factor (ECF subfamily)